MDRNDIGEALDIAREIGYRQGQGNYLGNLGNAYSDLGQVEKAIDYYEQALVIVREIGDRRGEGLWLWGLGYVYHQQGRKEKAIDFLSQALAILEEIKHPDAARLRNWLAELKGA